MAQENVRLRLAALYEDKGTLTVERKGNQYCTRIRFPYLKGRLKERLKQRLKDPLKEQA